MPEPRTPSLCARFHRAVELIGGRWTGAILQTLLQGRARYATIRSAIPDITDRMLSERLKSLEGEGLVRRIVIPESPVRVEYELTKMGRSLEPTLKALGSWAEEWIQESGAGAVSTETDDDSPGVMVFGRSQKSRRA